MAKRVERKFQLKSQQNFPIDTVGISLLKNKFRTNTFPNRGI
ncbi:hypothetical protein SAMN05444412_103368 [Rhodonellum ikkaensis]|uniref:Uncharacterized protein n=1 Tax=Rhodonellum ikkaensis TaxID=336829 RepID=A0A1H3NQD0_9BACT|nr:hypothetical protein SAMN05444412_103368 [Rhodonellum ikkaensis]